MITNINEYKNYLESVETITLKELLEIADMAGEIVPDAKTTLKELGVAYGDDGIPQSRVDAILRMYDLEDIINESVTDGWAVKFKSLSEVDNDLKYLGNEELHDEETGLTFDKNTEFETAHVSVEAGRLSDWHFGIYTNGKEIMIHGNPHGGRSEIFHVISGDKLKAKKIADELVKNGMLSINESKAKNKFVSNKISTLIDEGKPHKQAVAIAISMWEQKQKKKRKKVTESIDTNALTLSKDVIVDILIKFTEIDRSIFNNIIASVENKLDVKIQDKNEFKNNLIKLELSDLEILLLNIIEK